MKQKRPQLHPRTMQKGKLRVNVKKARVEAVSDNTGQIQEVSRLKPRSKGRWKKGVSGNPKGKPKGAKGRITVLRKAILENAPDLAAKIIESAKGGNIQALLSVLAPLMPAGKYSSAWSFGAIDTEEEIVSASKRILKAVEQGELTLDEGHKQQDLLSKHTARVNTTSDRRSEFEKEEIALSLIRGDAECRELAQRLATRFDLLERRALESGQLTAPAEHALIEVARRA